MPAHIEGTHNPPAGNVIALDRFRNGPGLSPIRQAEAYWTALKPAIGLPKRSQIDPRGLENILEHVFVLERIAPGIARFRLAGQQLVGQAGMELRGMPLSALFAADARNQIATRLEQLFAAPAIVELRLRLRPAGPGRGAHMILLPLEGNRSAADRALGVLIGDGAGLFRGTKFEISHSRVLDLGDPLGAGSAAAPLEHPRPHLVAARAD